MCVLGGGVVRSVSFFLSFPSRSATVLRRDLATHYPVCFFEEAVCVGNVESMLFGRFSVALDQQLVKYRRQVERGHCKSSS